VKTAFCFMFRFSQGTLDLKAHLSKIAQHHFLFAHTIQSIFLRVSRSILSSIGGSIYFWEEAAIRFLVPTYRGARTGKGRPAGSLFSKRASQPVPARLPSMRGNLAHSCLFKASFTCVDGSPETEDPEGCMIQLHALQPQAANLSFQARQALWEWNSFPRSVGIC